MKRKTLIAVALCLIMITMIGGAASSVADLPGYEDALSAATGTTPGAALSGSLRSLPGYQDALRGNGGSAIIIGSLRSLPGYRDAIANLGGMPGKGVPYSGTLQRINSNDLDYDLVFTDAYNVKYTLYLAPSNISPNTLPAVIATAVPVTVYMNDISSVTFVYNEVAYTASSSTTTLNTPYLTSDAHYNKHAIGGDAIFGTVWLNTFDGTTTGTYVQTPASGVHVQVFRWMVYGWEEYNTGSTNSNGQFCVQGPSAGTEIYKVEFILGDLSLTTEGLGESPGVSYCGTSL